jgi:hypothetical protein
VIVLSNNDGCAVARSDEAKALGIKMGAHRCFRAEGESCSQSTVEAGLFQPPALGGVFIKGIERTR